MSEVVLDRAVEEEVGPVRALIASAAGGDGRTLYGVTLEDLALGTRNTAAQLACLEAFERAVAVFRCAALSLREAMDVLTLEQRRAATSEADLPVPDDAVFFSNRYALYLAGQVGLAELGEAPAAVERVFAFGEGHRASKDRDALASLLAATTADRLRRVTADPESTSLGDDRLRHVFQAVFTAWCRQFNWETWQETAAATGTARLTLRLGPYSVRAGEFRRRAETVEVDERLMHVTRSDVIGCETFADTLWRNLRMLACYDAERGANPFDPAFVIFTYGAPGGGKTFVSHAHIRSFVDLCRERGQAAWAMTHSTTDYASHFQNKTQNELAALATRINAFPGPVVLYIADADNIFQSRKDPRLSSEQYRTLAVYLKMFDGTLIPRNGKFLAIMDANYIDGIDDATKSRLFDEIVELPRFERAEDFADLVRRTLGPLALSEEEWLAVGRHLLASPLSNREIGHVVKRLRRGFEIPDRVFELSFTEQAAFRDRQLSTLTRATILEQFDSYISTRMEIERKSAEERAREDQLRFLQFLGEGR
jgi:hypothetical protein